MSGKHPRSSKAKPKTNKSNGRRKSPHVGAKKSNLSWSHGPPRIVGGGGIPDPAGNEMAEAHRRLVQFNLSLKVGDLPTATEYEAKYNLAGPVEDVPTPLMLVANAAPGLYNHGENKFASPYGRYSGIPHVGFYLENKTDTPFEIFIRCQRAPAALPTVSSGQLVMDPFILKGLSRRFVSLPKPTKNLTNLMFMAGEEDEKLPYIDLCRILAVRPGGAAQGGELSPDMEALVVSSGPIVSAGSNISLSGGGIVQDTLAVEDDEYAINNDEARLGAGLSPLGSYEAFRTAGTPDSLKQAKAYVTARIAQELLTLRDTRTSFSEHYEEVLCKEANDNHGIYTMLDTDSGEDGEYLSKLMVSTYSKEGGPAYTPLHVDAKYEQGTHILIIPGSSFLTWSAYYMEPVISSQCFPLGGQYKFDTTHNVWRLYNANGEYGFWRSSRNASVSHVPSENRIHSHPNTPLLIFDARDAREGMAATPALKGPELVSQTELWQSQFVAEFAQMYEVIPQMGNFWDVMSSILNVAVTIGKVAAFIAPML